ncbi:hypothetical protein BGW38_001788 [Lunasporangiospora selenospora]|uniref:C2H2-type domain-containing protein n=1 Tax=Lunasporangiospora selenospora TaxID=979761 RepID=A0A9P6FV37_9FUNG|nr:hypothetical protein BGW38_001788 [Lunasporangiospora selenospora]
MDSSPSSVDNVVMESPRRRLELESVRARFEQGLAVVDDAESIHDEMTVGNALEAGTNENSSMQSFFEEQLVVGITSSPSPVLSPSCSTAKSSSVITMFGSAPASPSPPPPPPLLPLPTPFGSYTFGAEPVLASSSTKSLFPQEFLMPNGAFYRFDGTSLVPSSSSFMLHLQQATESMIESIPASGFMGSSALEGSVPAPGPQYLHPSALTLNSSLSAPMDAVSDTAMTIGSTLSTMFPRPGFAPPVFDFSSYIPLINSRGDGYNQSVQGSDNSHLGQHVRGDDDNNISSSSSSSVSSPGGSFIYDSRFYSTASGSLEESFSPLSTRVKNAKNRIQKRVLPRRTACKGTLTLRKTATHAFQGSLMTCSASRRPSVDSTYSSSSSSITNLNTSCFPNNFFMDSAAATGMAFANTNDPSSDGFLIASSSKDGTLEDAEEEAHVDKRDPSLRYRKNGAGKFACPFDGCNYRFNLNRELTRHRNVHLFAGKSRYQCANCETGLCRLDSVKRHMEAKGKKACLMNGLYKEFCEEGGLIATYACKESWYLAAEAAAAARRQNERTRARI